MKKNAVKGKSANKVAGFLDLIFGAVLLFIAINIILFVLDIMQLVPMLAIMLEIYYYILIKLGIFATSISTYYIYAGIIAFFGLMCLIFGIVTLVKTKKEPTNFYKSKGGLGFFAIFDTITLLFLLVHFLPYLLEGIALGDGYIFIILSAYMFVTVLFRYIGLGTFLSARKKYNK